MTLREEIRIAKPCPVAWDAMKVVNGSTRFCGQCKCNVYDIHKLSETEADRLLRGPDPVCGQIYLRADGMVKTGDCVPVERPGRMGSRRGQEQAPKPSVFARAQDYQMPSLRGMVVMRPKVKPETLEEKLKRQGAEDEVAEREDER